MKFKGWGLGAYWRIDAKKPSWEWTPADWTRHQMRWEAKDRRWRGWIEFLTWIPQWLRSFLALFWPRYKGQHPIRSWQVKRFGITWTIYFDRRLPQYATRVSMELIEQREAERMERWRRDHAHLYPSQ